jgi:hypothetical protein
MIYNETMQNHWTESKETYRANLKKWLADGYIGMYVAIKGGKVLGPFNSQNEANKNGYEIFGDDFLLSDIMPEPRQTNIAIKAG